jgi:hypothetical protein
MADDPTTKPKPGASQESSTTGDPSWSLRIGDPARRGFGDKVDESARRGDPSKAESGPDEQDEEDDAGEGHKGPRVDATKPSK